MPGPFRVRECWPALVHVNRASGPGGCSVVCGAGAGPAIPGDGGWVKNPSGVQGGLWQSRILQKPRVQLVIYEMQNNVKSRFSYEQLFYCSNVLCDSDSMQYVCHHTHIVVPSKTSSSANDQNLNQPLKVHLSFYRGPRDDI